MTVVGPTLHGLAATTMLVVVMPFALVRVFDATSRKSWWLNALAFTLMLVGAVATDRKTALLVPVALVIYLACYRPRQVLRLAPIGLVVLVGLVHFASPGALGTIFTPTAGTRKAAPPNTASATSPTSRPTCSRIRCSDAASARSIRTSPTSSGSTTTSTSTRSGRSAWSDCSPTCG